MSAGGPGSEPPVGVVLAVLAWIYLQAPMLMISAEINVVLHRRL